jgi:hypothetical protein
MAPVDIRPGKPSGFRDGAYRRHRQQPSRMDPEEVLGTGPEYRAVGLDLALRRQFQPTDTNSGRHL